MSTARRRHRSFLPLALVALWLAAPATAQAAWTFSTPTLGTGSAPTARLLDVSCPSRRLCVAVDDAGTAWSTVRPGDAAVAWQPTAVRAGLALDDISCAATGFCAAVRVGEGSVVATSSQPTGAAAAWTVTDLQLRSDGGDGPEPDDLLTVGCASARLCVAATFSTESNLAVSLDPGVSAPAWRTTAVGNVRGGDLFQAISCPSRVLCVAAGSFGKVATSTDAGGHWRFAYLLGPRDRNGSLTPRIEDASCPTTTFCAAVDRAGHVVTSGKPAGGPRAWHRVRLSRRRALSAISCASASLCAGLGPKGRVFVSTQPAGPASSWKAARVGQPIRHVSCASTRLCLFVTSGGEALAGKRQ